MKFAGCLSLMLLCHLNGFSQEESQDTIRHSVKKAAIFSAILPGAGQVYNHRAMPKGQRKAFWKVPLIYAGLGATAYFLHQNNSLQKELKQEYLDRQNGNPTLEKYQFYDSQGILSLYQTHLSRRDLFIVGVAAVYAIQVLDAAVEAHFVSFDVSEDLSLRLSPSIVGFGTPGLKLCLKFVK